MNVAMVVRITKFWLKETNFCVFFGAFCAELKHLAHCRVAVDVRIAALDVGIFRSVSLGDRAISLHEFALAVRTRLRS